jgi:uncharacterized protein (TIGR03067 family)
VTKRIALGVVASLSLSALLGAASKPAPPAEKPTADQQAIQGTWRPVKEEMRGGPAPGDVREHRMVFAGDGFKLVGGADEVLLRGTFVLDPTKQPRRIEMKVSDGAGGDPEAPVHGIYELNGDELKWCAAEPGAADAPAKFETKGTTHVLIVLKRAAPAGAGPQGAGN